MIKQRDIYGLLAEFDGPESLLVAAEKTHAAGYHSTDAFTPFPVHGMAEALGHPKTLVPRMVLIGGIIGGLMLEGGKIRDITQVTAAMIVLGGTCGAVMVSMPLRASISVALRSAPALYVVAESSCRRCCRM